MAGRGRVGSATADQGNRSHESGKPGPHETSVVRFVGTIHPRTH